jgi:segregation and condensation protein A
LTVEYKVKLERFEGPLDLLLFLIKKEEINIYDIPIAQITRQYLEYIRMMELLNLELAGEFLVMAATLMRIKARTLLPRNPEEAEEEDDPRLQLVQQLVEYQRFKQAAGGLEAMEYQRRLLFPRPEGGDGDDIVELECACGLFDLIAAFKKVLEKAEVRCLDVKAEEISIEEKIEFLRRKIEEAEVLAFGDLFEAGSPRSHLVVTFLALLEILRQGFATVKQTKAFGEIWIHRASPGRTSSDTTEHAGSDTMEQIDGRDQEDH